MGWSKFNNTFIWICPTCKGRYHTEKEATSCRNTHFPLLQNWWFCKCGYGIKLDNRSDKSIEIEIKSHCQPEICRIGYEVSNDK